MSRPESPKSDSDPQLPVDEIFAAFLYHDEQKFPLIFHVEPKPVEIAQDDQKPKESAPQTEAYTEALVESNPSKYDVVQGMLGNCYFLASIAALLNKAQGGKILLSCMRDLSEPYNFNGEMTTLGKALGLDNDQKIIVRLFDINVPDSVGYAIIDKSTIVGNYRAQSPFYIQVLEKAFAGLFKEQDMTHLSSGEPRQALAAFLGEMAQPKIKKVSSMSEAQLETLLKSPSLLSIISTKNNLGVSKEKGIAGEKIVDGLAASHAYAVEHYQAREFSKSILGKEYKQLHQGICIFNPWGINDTDSISGMRWQLDLVRKPSSLLPSLCLVASPSGTTAPSSWMPISAIKEKMQEICHIDFDDKVNYAARLSMQAMAIISKGHGFTLILNEPSLQEYVHKKPEVHKVEIEVMQEAKEESVAVTEEQSVSEIKEKSVAITEEQSVQDKLDDIEPISVPTPSPNLFNFFQLPKEPASKPLVVPAVPTPPTPHNPPTPT